MFMCKYVLRLLSLSLFPSSCADRNRSSQQKEFSIYGKTRHIVEICSRLKVITSLLPRGKARKRYYHNNAGAVGSAVPDASRKPCGYAYSLARV
ncbi:hypothetical protein ACQKWADRAFT_286031, partial [Trichoderma austrokoningii]